MLRDMYNGMGGGGGRNDIFLEEIVEENQPRMIRIPGAWKAPPVAL